MEKRSSEPYDRRDWVAQLFRLQGSVLPHIAPKVAFLSVLSWGLTTLENRFELRRLPIAPFTVVGMALGLLLTFRTNASYDRFWEARKAWGIMVNRCRNLARQALIAFDDTKSRWEVGAHLCAFAHAVKRQLWRERKFPEVERILGAQSSVLNGPPGPAQRCLVELSAQFARARSEGRLDDFSRWRMEEDLTVLLDQLGICERIQNAPIPIGYVLHLRRFLVFYCVALTLALVDPLGWYAPIAVAFVSYAFLGIERVGIEIEEPFERTPNDLNLENIASTIERDVSALLESECNSPVSASSPYKTQDVRREALVTSSS